MASVRDVALIGVIVFALGLIYLLIHFAGTTMFDALIAQPAVNESENAVTVLEGAEAKLNMLDWALLAIFLGLSFALIITGYLVGGEPLFMIIYFIIIVVAVVVSSLLAYVWDTVSAASVFGASAASFPIASHLLGYLPVYVGVVGMIGLIAMFAKPRE